MTCHDFQSILVDLARERDLDDPTREAASSHTRGCGNCARALAVERELSGRLAALAAATRDASAPDRVEMGGSTHSVRRPVGEDFAVSQPSDREVP